MISGVGGGISSFESVAGGDTMAGIRVGAIGCPFCTGEACGTVISTLAGGVLIGGPVQEFRCCSLRRSSCVSLSNSDNRLATF